MRWQARLLGPAPFLAALGWLAGLTLVFGTEDLPAAETARLLEGFCPVCGVFLFIGLFAPEADRGLRDCVAMRRAPYLGVCALRALWPLGAAALYSAGAALFLAARGCAVPGRLGLAAFANALFLGALALLCAVLLGGTVAGAVPPLAWLLLDSLTGRLGSLSLLRQTTGVGLPKPAVPAAALALFAAAFLVRRAQLRRGDSSGFAAVSA